MRLRVADGTHVREVLDIHPKLPFDPGLLLHVVKMNLFPHTAVAVGWLQTLALTLVLILHKTPLHVTRRIDAFFGGVLWICSAFWAAVEVGALAR